MATNTTNLSLIKPDLTDKIRIAQINQNMDIIDLKMGAVGSTSLQSQVTPLTTKTANYDKLIANGTNLDSLLTTGVYRSPATNAGVNTLVNCPVGTPFVLIVRGENSTDGCVQLLSNGSSIYARLGTSSGLPSTWTIPMVEVPTPTVAVTGTTPSITGEASHKYICGEVSTISITAPASGTISVVFESGTTPAVLTTSGITFPEWFDDTSLEANTTYEINVSDGLGVVTTWA